MTKTKATTGKKRSKPASTVSRGPRKPVDLEAVRRQISELVGNQAVDLVEITIAEADKGHYPAMKYLFELIGLYPATEQEVVLGEDSLAKTLLKRLGFPDEPVAERGVTKDYRAVGDAVATGDDAVK